jgi:glycosyltransferase involved in cell wall biosynthesis
MSSKPSRTRVCVVVSGHPNVIMGGSQYQAHLLAEELARRENVSVTYVGRGMPEGKDAEGLPYEVLKAGHDRGLWRKRGLFFDASDLRDALTRIQPHVIYQRMKQSYTAVCSHYARKHGIPMFFHVASAADVDPKWIGNRLSQDTPFRLAEGVLGNWGLRKASHILVQSKAQARLLEKNFARAPSRLVHNFQPLPGTLTVKAGDKTRVLWVGNFKDVKRPELFVQIAKSLSARPDIEFWMVGKPAHQARYEPVMADIRNCENLRYFGALPLKEVNILMSQADVFVNTSAFEGFPNTFIQAWGYGAVVVSLVVDIDDGLDAQGIGFCAGDFDRLKIIIADLASSAERRKAIAVRAFEHVHRNHSPENAVRLADFMLAEAAAAPGSGAGSVRRASDNP